MKWILLAIMLGTSGCSFLTVAKDCAKAESNESIGDNKFICREVMPWN